MKLKQHLGACTTLVVVTTVIAQRPDILKGQLAHTFCEVTAVHELCDGRALVLDSHDRFLYLADFQSETVQRIGDQGAPIPFTPTTVTPAIQKAWLEVLYRPRVVWAALGGGQYGFAGASEPVAEYGSWPPVLPSRLPNSYIGFAGHGSLVVERLALPGIPSQYDVIGARGELVDRFQLAPNTQIVATGNRDVYLTTRGSDGRLTLQRFSVRSR